MHTDSPILFVGDVHDKGSLICPAVEHCLADTGANTVVLLGDLLNDWLMGARGEINEFRVLHEHVTAWRRNGINVIVLLGNHDIIYTLDDPVLRRRMRYYSPGYNPDAYEIVHPLLMELEPRIVYVITRTDDTQVLCSHAGFTAGWLEYVQDKYGLSEATNAQQLSEQTQCLFDQYPLTFLTHVGPARGGDQTTAISPVWADRRELTADPMLGDVTQIVGHTPVPTITWQPETRAWFCDTFSETNYGEPLGDRSMLLLDVGNIFRKIPWNANIEE